jgi:Flp pilus assembly pilin Flp
MNKHITTKPAKLSQRRRRHRRRGFISIEWILILTIVVIGIVGGLSAVRNAILDELGDICRCITAIEICEPAPPANTPAP